MRILCDVCDKEEASMFCSADEAALCNGCDHHVHFANNLARKHLRFSLLQPEEPPLCDICKERRAYIFCQEDRAILCRECDFPIHIANEQTQNHNRFLLSGLKLSPSSNIAENTTINDEKKNLSSCQSSSIKKTRTVSNEIFSSPSVENYGSDAGSMSTSSISEYLMETLPGWRVDDFLYPTTTPNGFCKTGDSFFAFGDDQDLQTSSLEDSSDYPSWALKISPESNQDQDPFCLWSSSSKWFAKLYQKVNRNKEAKPYPEIE